ncbi:MAG TPA: histidine kinase [Clostridiales bacterium]|nr:histidine kinase [Clostridiales bacterium]
MKFYKSIKFKFLACLLLVSILPVLIIFVFTLNSNSRFYQSQLAQVSNNEMKSITTRINTNLESQNNLLTSLIFSKYDNESCILSICEQEGKGKNPTPYERLSSYRKFEYVCSNLIANNEYAEGIYLFNESQYTYSFVKNREFWLEEHYKDSEWYNRLVNQEELQVVVMYQPPHKNQEKVIFARYFTDVKGKNGSVLAVVCNNKIFENKPSWGKGFILDQGGTAIYGGTEQNLTQTEKNQILEKDSGVIIRGKNEDAYIYGSLDANHWKIVSKISFGPLDELYQKNTRYLIRMIAVILVFVLILLVVSERIFIKPLEKLAQIMNHTKGTNITFENTQKEREDEIGILYRGYETMIGEINELIQEKYVGQIEFLKSRLKNLMSQINAHFIFNTLENINCLAEIEKNRKIAIMSKSLGDMLRYSIEYEEDEEKLSVEIGHIKQYIQIQEIRFENKIALELEIDEGLEEATVLKFMLQPIIENAIEHGMAGRDVPWIIQLRAFREGDRLILWIQDNGTGMEEEELVRVRDLMWQTGSTLEDSRYSSIGLSNIHKRLQLLYSQAAGLYLENLPKKGLRVVVYLPYH